MGLIQIKLMYFILNLNITKVCLFDKYKKYYHNNFNIDCYKYRLLEEKIKILLKKIFDF